MIRPNDTVASLRVLESGNARARASAGAVEACRQCSGVNCCGTLRPGGPVEPPFLTTADINLIEYHTGLRRDQFSNDRVNPVTGDRVSFMQTHEGSGCVFFDKTEGRCGIYRWRPVDCRLFPLDIEKDGDTYYWAIHKHESCRLTPADKRALLKFGKTAVAALREDMHNYATVPVPGMTAVGYDRVGRVSDEFAP